MAIAAATGTKRFHFTGERLFYSGMGLMILALVLAGFGPGFLAQLNGTGAPPGPNALIHVHGAVFLAWVLLFIAQAALISVRAQDWHRRLGSAAMMLAAAMVAIGVAVTIGQYHRGTAPAGLDPLSWMLVPLVDMLLFGSLVAAGFAWRREPQVHKRLMLGAILIMLQPGVGRMPMIGPDVLAGENNAIIAWALSLLLLVWDFVQRGRPHAVSLIVIGALGVGQVLRWLVWETETWRAFARMLVGAG